MSATEEAQEFGDYMVAKEKERAERPVLVREFMAADLAVEGRTGRMVALRADVVTDVSLTEWVSTPRAIPDDQYDAARACFD